MSNTTLEQCGQELALANEATELQPAGTASPARKWAQRGMVTAEYAVGILAAIALALVLFNIFNDSKFISQMTNYVTQLIAYMGKQIPK